jgi:hypothetical protein
MVEAGLNIEDLLQHKVGEPGTPIRRITEKATRADIARWLNERSNAWPPEICLRAYLAIGRTPEPKLLNAPVSAR